MKKLTTRTCSMGCKDQISISESMQNGNCIASRRDINIENFSEKSDEWIELEKEAMAIIIIKELIDYAERGNNTYLLNKLKMIKL